MDKAATAGQWRSLVYFPTKLACSTYTLYAVLQGYKVRLISCSLTCEFQPFQRNDHEIPSDKLGELIELYSEADLDQLVDFAAYFWES
jgi:hypothetical protein